MPDARHPRCSTNASSRCAPEAGASGVEMALLLPLLLFIAGLIMDLGLYYIAGPAVQSAVFRTAREAVTRENLGPADYSTLRSRVVNLMPRLGFFTLTDADVTVENLLDTDTARQMFRVSVNKDYEFRFLRFVGFSTLPVKRESTLYYERQ